MKRITSMVLAAAMLASLSTTACSAEKSIPEPDITIERTAAVEFIPPLHPVPLSMVTANAHLLKFFPKRCIIRLLLKKSIFVFRTEKRTRIF